MEKPLVSIIIPVYNGGDYLNQAIDSALRQTYPRVEVLVINDGSCDGGETERIALSYGERIRYFTKENGGVSSALNMGIRSMRGEYFSWLSHDDVYAPDKVEQAMQVCGRDRLVLCGYDFIDAEGKTLAKKGQAGETGSYTWQQAVRYITERGANGCAFLIPRQAFDRAGLFCEELRYCQDTLMWWNLFLSGYDLRVIGSVGVHSRLHARQVSRTRPELFYRDAAYIAGVLPERLGRMSTRQNNCLLAYGKREAVYGCSAGVRESLCIGRQTGLIRWYEALLVRWLQLYGVVRPALRRVYYALLLSPEG